MALSANGFKGDGEADAKQTCAGEVVRTDFNSHAQARGGFASSTTKRIVNWLRESCMQGYNS